MTCPLYDGNRISEDLNFKIFRGRMPLDPHTGDGFGGPLYRTPFCEILDPPQTEQIWFNPITLHP